MGLTIIKNGDNTASSVVELYVDTLAEINALPTDDTYGIGSDALCLEDSSVWILGTDKVWHEL